MPNLLYDGNTNTGGTAPVDASSPYLEGDTVTVLGLGDLVKTGYRFIDWDTASDGSGTNYDEGDTFLMPATDVTLYAQWAAEYSVVYDGNGSTGGSVPVDASSPYLDTETVTVLGNTGSLVKTGNVFAGWNTASDGSGTTYAPGATFAVDGADVTLYAIWTDIPDNTVTTKAINASTFTAKRTVTADDETNGAIVFDFQTLRDLAAVVTVVTDASVVAVADIAVSYPAAGKVRVSGTGLVEDYIVSVFAAINSLDPVYKYS